MKRNWIVCLLCLVLCAVLAPAAMASDDVAIDEKNFPDAAVRAYVAEAFDADGNGVLSPGEIEAAEEIDLSGSEAVSLNSISYFPNLRSLDVSNTKTKELNLAASTALERLNVANCPIKALDVSMLPALRELDTSGNKLTALDLSANEAMEILRCANNGLKTLDVTKLTALKELDASGNKLTALDLSMNKALEALNCSGNGLETLDATGSRGLKTLDCSRNKLAALAVKKLGVLETLDCSGNALKKLNVTGNPALRVLNCSGNWLSKLNLYSNFDLERIICQGNDIHGLDIRSNSLLMKAYTGGTVTKSKSCTTLSYTDTEAGKVYEISTDPDTMLQDGSVAGPNVTTHPKDASAESGKKVTFSVTATGKNAVYRWYCKQPNTAYWTRLAGENGPNLTLKAEKQLNGNRYRCEVINRGGTAVSSGAKLTVIFKPRILTQPRDLGEVEGKKVTFTVKAEGGELNYQWYRQRSGETGWTKLEDETEPSLTVASKPYRDRTKYRCVVSNSVGEATSDEAKLVVFTEPTVTEQPETATVKKGKKATFKVKASGGGLSYQWYVKKAGEDQWTPLTGETSRTLQFKVTKKMNGNKYRCRISNRVGRTYSKAVTLHVE